MVAVIFDGEDELVGCGTALGVVLQEEFLIVGVKDIAHVDDGLGVFCRA